VKVMITGAAGQVGRALLASVPPSLEARAFTRAQLDISDSEAVRAAVAGYQPALIINAAAYTAVDKAESEPQSAAAINAEGPGNLARAALAVAGCRLIHISTDYVFDGTGVQAYKPADPTNPVSVYGRTKLQGEQLVLGVLHERAVVLRTAWVYAATGKNFLLTMLRLMREHGAVRVVNDQHGTPTTAASIAGAIWAIAERPDIHGIVHWTDSGTASWYDFAVAIAEDGRAAGLLPGPVKVTGISTAEYPTAARRPANSALDTRDSLARVGLTPPPWRDNLRATLQELARA
jgi:dTDP-4-dehydrorhamnose reductase